MQVLQIGIAGYPLASAPGVRGITYPEIQSGRGPSPLV